MTGGGTPQTVTMPDLVGDTFDTGKIKMDLADVGLTLGSVSTQSDTRACRHLGVVNQTPTAGTTVCGRIRCVDYRQDPSDRCLPHPH
jgi:beta-lactam-binding protein with PASTA domain